MSKKKTPQEKKKSQVNRVVRRKSKNLLHQVENSSYEKLGPEEESLTAELFRMGLSRKKLLKVGVVSLQEKIERKREYRMSSFNIKARSHAGRTAGFRKFVCRLLDDKEYTEDNLLHLSRLTNFGHFQTFLEEEPSWVPKLEQWLLSAQKRIGWRQSKVKQCNP